MAEQKNIASAQEPSNSSQTLLPDISQLTSQEDMNGIPMNLDTIVLEGLNNLTPTNTSTDWRDLYMKTGRLISKLRSGHQLERDGLVEENLKLHTHNEFLRSVVLHSKHNNSKALAEERSVWEKKIEILKLRLAEERSIAKKNILALELKLADLKTENYEQISQVESQMDELKVQNKNLMKSRIFERGRAQNLESEKERLEKRIIEQDGTIVDIRDQVSVLEREISKIYSEVLDLDHVLEVYSEVVESIMDRKREWSRPSHFRDINIIHKGNKIAHGGTCLADAYRIMSSHNTDSRWYREYYGTTPETVIQFGTSEAFEKLINMRYELYRYRENVGTAADGFEEGFQKLLGIILENKNATAESVQSLLVGDMETDMRNLYQDLCVLWKNGIRKK
ncbi:hypothetical protein NHQ30_005736 [Ciborinia camelliae]|nr:hypothetical protein NHQ30_005736 [Ciborinia camelliae]